MKGLFRDGIESTTVVPLAGKFAIKVKYVDGKEETLNEPFDTVEQAQIQIEKTRKAKHS